LTYYVYWKCNSEFGNTLHRFVARRNIRTRVNHYSSSDPIAPVLPQGLEIIIESLEINSSGEIWYKITLEDNEWFGRWTNWLFPYNMAWIYSGYLTFMNHEDYL